jgi:hypothetical protein
VSLDFIHHPQGLGDLGVERGLGAEEDVAVGVGGFVAVIYQLGVGADFGGVAGDEFEEAQNGALVHAAEDKGRGCLQQVLLNAPAEFPPLAQTLTGFFIILLLGVIATGTGIYTLFRRGRKSWALWLTVTMMVFLTFGVPIFIVENDQALWHRDPFGEKQDNQQIDFTPEEAELLNAFYRAYTAIWGNVYYLAPLYIFAYLGVSFFRMKRKK